jgi:hypothetical protein
MYHDPAAIPERGRHNFARRGLPPGRSEPTEDGIDGLGILVPDERLSDAVRRTLDSFFTPDSLMECCFALEQERMYLRVELAACRGHLTQPGNAAT